MNVCGKDVRVDGNVIRIGRLSAEKYDYVDDPRATLAALRSAGSRVDIFTFIQKLPETTPRFTYPLEWDNVAALEVSTFDHWWNKTINGKTRNMVRRAEKAGVVVRETPFDEELVQGISDIYNESRMRQGKNFWHYGKSLAQVRAENSTFSDRSVFIGAYLEGKLIGFAKLVWDESKVQAGLMQILSMMHHRDKSPTNALLAQAVRSCAHRSIPYLIYSSFAYGHKQRDSLSDFKEHNGFKRVDVPRYYVPLTLVGRGALGLGLHHRLADRIPEPLAARLRSLRGMVVNRRMESTGQSSSAA
jgi:hypothetical protein